MPLFVLKCEIEESRINILETSINIETINTVLAIKLNKELADISIEYKEPMYNYNKEIESLIDASNVEEIMNLYYSKLQEYIELSKEDIKSINKLNKKYHFNEEFVVSLDVIADEAIKYIKEDIELELKLINNNGYIPNLLDKYLNGSLDKKDLNDLNYTKIYRGNYINKEGYGVGENQYKIINTIEDNDLIAIEGPPGTGKTSLLKEIIANKIVKRADLLLKNWNKNFSEIKRNNSVTYFELEGFNNNDNIVKSIVVSSKNGEAIENVGTEIDKQIKYMYPVARQYKRTNTVGGKKQKEIQKYKGIICLPLGKQDNVQDFKDFLYQKFIPMLEKIQSKKNIEQISNRIKENYKNQCKKVDDYENLINSFKNIKDWNKYFYNIKISHKKSNIRNDELKIKNIQQIFEEDKILKEEKMAELESRKRKIDIKKKDNEKEKRTIKNSLENVNDKIRNSKKIILENKSDIKYLKERENNFSKISKNIFTKLLNFSEYRKNKNTDFYGAINGKKLEIDIENQKMSQYISEFSKLEKDGDEIEEKYNQLKKEYEKTNVEYNKIAKELNEIRLIEKFNQVDKRTFWNYKNIIDMAGRSTLNDLNQELFSAALKLNEAYIIKHSEEIIKNLKLFLPREENSYICQKFYDSSDFYSEDKQKAIKNLWNTVFLCFPVVTTTLDSFTKRCFHLIPEYVDLELIDEAGQILPHNFVSAAYRGKRAFIVGDVNQIEPIVKNINTDLIQSQKNLSGNLDNVKVETNSVQSLANRNTDI